MIPQWTGKVSNDTNDPDNWTNGVPRADAEVEPARWVVPEADTVDHPTHYNTGKIEVIDFIEDQRLGFNLGNVIKYVCRAEHKGTELPDLQKAKWYLEREIAKREGTLVTTTQKNFGGS